MIPAPHSNTKPSTQFSPRSDRDPSSDSKPGRAEPSRESAQSMKSVHFEPFEKRSYDLSYACLLIPRDPEHLLTGKLADFIGRAIQTVCIAFGWSLLMVQVQPEYFQWVVSAKVGTPPSKCIHTIREETSKGILGAFRHLRGETHDDFWAPGYLLLVGSEPHPPAVIQEFIKLTRQQQGISKQDRSGQAPGAPDSREV